MGTQGCSTPRTHFPASLTNVLAIIEHCQEFILQSHHLQSLIWIIFVVRGRIKSVRNSQRQRSMFLWDSNHFCEWFSPSIFSSPTSLSWVLPGPQQSVCSAALSLTPLPLWEYLCFTPYREDLQPERNDTNTPGSLGMAPTALVTPSESHFLLHQTPGITKRLSVKRNLVYTLFYTDIKT